MYITETVSKSNFNDEKITKIINKNLPKLTVIFNIDILKNFDFVCSNVFAISIKGLKTIKIDNDNNNFLSSIVFGPKYVQHIKIIK